MDDRIQRRHEHHYYGYGSAVPMESCWFCQKNARRCRSKIRYTTACEATDQAKSLNAGLVLGRPVMPYACPWCEGWHLTSRLNRRSLRKVEKWRRKTLR